MISALATAPWFSHLGQAARGPLVQTGFEPTGVLTDVLEHMPGPHVLSVALPTRPTPAQMDRACALGRAIRELNAFTVVTVSQPSQGAVTRLGESFDCLIDGDGSVHHHWYPSRTVTEPRNGRTVCYDLYDVWLLWAGRIGKFGIVEPTADALHVEVSADVESLSLVDSLVSEVASELTEYRRLRLFNVVDGARSRATGISFSDSKLIRQERAAKRQNGE